MRKEKIWAWRFTTLTIKWVTRQTKLCQTLQLKLNSRRCEFWANSRFKTQILPLHNHCDSPWIMRISFPGIHFNPRWNLQTETVKKVKKLQKSTYSPTHITLFQDPSSTEKVEASKTLYAWEWYVHYSSSKCKHSWCIRSST